MFAKGVTLKTCLIVDDSHVVRFVLSRIVADLGMLVAQAADGHAALDVCRRRMPDAILLDWNMPVMNGLEFLNALAAEAGSRRPPVIFCTGEESAKSIMAAMAAGASDYVLKPFDRATITGKLRQVGLLAEA